MGINNRKNKLLALVISVCFLIVPITSISAQTVSNKTDVLLVKIGDDEAIDETYEIMNEILALRNEKIKIANDRKWTEISEQNKMLSIVTNSKMSLNVISGQYLKFKGIEVSIDDLAEGILETYDTSIIIIIGHGSPVALTDGMKEMSWVNVNTVLEDANFPLSLLAACYGGKAAMDSGNIIGVESEIDNVFAAYLFSTVIYKAFGDSQAQKYTMQKVFDRMEELSIDPEKIKLLSIKGMEVEYWIIYIIVSLIQLLIGLAFDPSGGFIKKCFQLALLNFGMLGFVGIMNSFILLFQGALSAIAFIGTISGFVLALLGYAISAVSEQSFWWKLLYGTIFVLELTAIILSGSALLIIKLLPWITAAIYIGTSLYREDKDHNDVPCQF